MRRQLLAILLVAVYAAVSTLGTAFVSCVESDGTFNIEALGASCCASVAPAIAADCEDEQASASANPTNEDCDDCQGHIAAIDIETQRIEDGQTDPISPVVLPPAVPSGWSAASSAWLSRSSLRVLTPPPRCSPTLACLRSVVLRC